IGIAVTVDLAHVALGLDEEGVRAGAIEDQRRVATDRGGREVGDGVVVALARQHPEHNCRDQADDERDHAEEAGSIRCSRWHRLTHHTPRRSATSSMRSSGCTTAMRTWPVDP